VVPVNGPRDTRELAALTFDKEARYFFVYEGSQTWNKVKLGAIALLVLALCMYPLWPASVRVVVWYISVTLLLAIVGFTLAQFGLFAITWLFGYEFWILPNIWAEAQDSWWELLQPWYSFEKSGGGQGYYRVATLAVLAGLGYWVYTQPSGKRMLAAAGSGCTSEDFCHDGGPPPPPPPLHNNIPSQTLPTPAELDAFLATQRQFVDDLYSGTLLGDGSAGAGMAGAGGINAGMFGARRGGAPIPDIREFEKMFEPTPAPAATEGEAAAAAGGSADTVAAAAATQAAAHSAGEATDAAMDALLDSHDDNAAAAADAADEEEAREDAAAAAAAARQPRHDEV
jgi:hypothetical protein